MTNRPHSFLQRLLASGAVGVLPLLPAVAQTDAFWSNAADGNWTTASNWSVDPAVPFNGFPNPLDRYEVWINATGSPYTVTLDFSIEVDSLTVDSADATVHHTDNQINLNGGMLDLRAGHYQLDGGTLGNMTITSSGGTFGFGPGDQTFDGIIFDQVDLFGAPGQRIFAPNNFAINGGTLFLGGATLFTSEVQGAGTVVMNSGRIDGDDELVITRDTTILSTGLGNHSLEAHDRIANRGTIIADGMNHTLGFDPDLFINTGTAELRVVNGAYVYNRDGTFDNRGELYIDGASSVSFEGFVNTGTLTAEAGASLTFTNFAGSPDDFGNLSAQGANIYYTGSLDLGGGTFDLAGAQWFFDDISNGTITGIGGGAIRDGNFDNIVLDTEARITGNAFATNGIEVTAGNAIVLEQRLPNNTLARFTTSALNGLGELRFEAAHADPTGYSILQSSPGGTVVVASDFTVRANGSDAYFGQMDLTNHGTIIAENSHRLWQDFGSLTNHGTLRATNAGVLDLVNVTNHGSIEIDSFGALYLDGDWTNPGTITLNSGSVRLGGRFDTAQLGGLTVNGGVVSITGEIDATATPFVVGSQGVWLIGGVPGENETAVLTGQLVVPEGDRLIATQAAGLTDLTLDGRIDVIDSHRVNFSGDTVLVDGAEIHAMPSAGTTFFQFTSEPQSITGVGAIVFDTPGTPGYISMSHTGVLTLGAGVTLRTGTGSGFINQGTLVNQGTILAEGIGQTLHFADTLNNTGTIEVRNGGTIQLNPQQFTNTGTLHLDGGALRLADVVNIDEVPSYTQANGGWVEVTGSFNLVGQTWDTDGTRGGLVVGFGGDGATVFNGTVDATGGTALIFNAGTTLFSAEFLGEAILRDGATVRLSHTAPLNGQTLHIGGETEQTRLLLLNRDLLANGSATLIFDGPGDTGLAYMDDVGTFALGAGVTVRAIGGDAQLGRFSHETVNFGTIRAESPGHTLTLQTDTASVNHGTNHGLIEALPGSSITFSGEWRNQGTIRLGDSGERSNATHELRLLTGSVLEIDWAATTSPGDDVVLGGMDIFDQGGALVLTTAEGFTPERGDHLLLFDAFDYQSTFETVTVDGVAADDYVLIEDGRYMSIYLPFFGDATLDGFVGAEDLDLLLANWGDSVGTDAWTLGDFDADGFVGQSDLDLLRANWGSATALGPATVPEPAGLVLLLSGLALMTARRRRL
ncbi:PEP-CTERM sorting domain-containing protein [Phycisphaeraceae bacterium D3-23]